MRPPIALQTHRVAIRQIALNHRVKNVRVFGSVLHLVGLSLSGGWWNDEHIQESRNNSPSNTIARLAIKFAESNFYIRLGKT